MTLLGVTLATFVISIVKETSQCSWYFIITVLTFALSLLPFFSKNWDTKPSERHTDLDLSLNGSFFEIQDERITLKSCKNLLRSVALRFVTPMLCVVILYPFGTFLFDFVKKIFVFFDVAFEMKIMMVVVTPITVFIVNEVYAQEWRDTLEVKWEGKGFSVLSGTKFAELRNTSYFESDKGSVLGGLASQKRFDQSLQGDLSADDIIGEELFYGEDESDEEENESFIDHC